MPFWWAELNDVKVAEYDFEKNQVDFVVPWFFSPFAFTPESQVDCCFNQVSFLKVCIEQVFPGGYCFNQISF